MSASHAAVASGTRRAALQLGLGVPGLQARRLPAAATLALVPYSRRSFANGRNFNGGFGGFGGQGFPGQAQQPSGDSEKLYKLLGVERSADDSAIKSAYKKQAMKHHPDRGGDESTFKEISKAYDVLSNPEKRQVYDTYGEPGLEGMDQGGGGPAAGGDPFDLFSQIFGFNAGGRRQRGRPSTPDSSYEMQLTLEELYAGTRRSITFTRDALCKTCDGNGGKNRRQCQRCKGTGRQVTVQQMGMFVQQFESECAPCDGKGYIIPPADICKTCTGKGTVKERQPLDVVVEQGAQDGQEFRFKGLADEAPGHDTGDVVIMVRQKPHKTFQRIRDSLVLAKKITLAEALCGVEFSTTFLDGQELTIRSTPGKVIKPGDLMIVEGKGMPRSHGQRPGNMFVRFEIEFPQSIEREGQEKLAEVLGGAPLSEVPPLGSEHARKLTSRQTKDIKEQWAQLNQGRSGGQGNAQNVQCAQQ